VSGEQWGVWIDEVGILATGKGSDWWVQQSVRMQASGVLVDLDMVPIAGGVYLMRCDDEENATFVAEHMAEHIHGKFAQPMTLAAARKKIRAQHAKRRGHRVCTWCRPEEA
jgi:hypothetical protein